MPSRRCDPLSSSSAQSEGSVGPRSSGLHLCLSNLVPLQHVGCMQVNANAVVVTRMAILLLYGNDSREGQALVGCLEITFMFACVQVDTCFGRRVFVLLEGQC